MKTSPKILLIGWCNSTPPNLRPLKVVDLYRRYYYKSSHSHPFWSKFAKVRKSSWKVRKSSFNRYEIDCFVSPAELNVAASPLQYYSSTNVQLYYSLIHTVLQYNGAVVQSEIYDLYNRPTFNLWSVRYIYTWLLLKHLQWANVSYRLKF